MLYVHGFADYFFQTELADFFAERGLAFYALDLRKSGRARGDGHTAHYVTDLELYDAELDAAWRSWPPSTRPCRSSLWPTPLAA